MEVGVVFNGYHNKIKKDPTLLGSGKICYNECVENKQHKTYTIFNVARPHDHSTAQMGTR